MLLEIRCDGLSLDGQSMTAAEPFWLSANDRGPAAKPSTSTSDDDGFRILVEPGRVCVHASAFGQTPAFYAVGPDVVLVGTAFDSLLLRLGELGLASLELDQAAAFETMLVAGVALVLYPLLAFTPVAAFLTVAGGHLGELVIAGVPMCRGSTDQIRKGHIGIEHEVGLVSERRPVRVA